MKRPYLQFYFGDWRANAKVQGLSFHLRGVWIEVMGLMHDSDEYGVLRWPIKKIASAVRCKVSDVTELHLQGVLKGRDEGAVTPLIYTPRSGRKDGDSVHFFAHQHGPLWYSSRMVVDEHIRNRRGVNTGAYNTNVHAPKASLMPSPKGGFDVHQSPHPPEDETEVDGRRVVTTPDWSDF